MSDKALEYRIEQLRLKMYQAYNYAESKESALHISEELDMLLNQLNEIRKQS